MLLLTSCEKLGIHLFKPSYSKTQFIRMTVVRGDNEFELEGFRKLAGLGGYNYQPWIELDKAIDITERSDSLFYTIKLYSGYNTKGVTLAPFAETFIDQIDNPLTCVFISELTLHIPSNPGWVFGKVYNLENTKRELQFKNSEKKSIMLTLLREASTDYALGDELCYDVTSCEIETIAPSGNMDDYYAVQFRLSAINEDGEEVFVYGTVQNRNQ